MKTYKFILGIFFILAAFGLSLFAIALILNIATMDEVIANATKLFTILVILFALSTVVAIVSRSMSKLSE